MCPEVLNRGQGETCVLQPGCHKHRPSFSMRCRTTRNLNSLGNRGRNIRAYGAIIVSVFQLLQRRLILVHVSSQCQLKILIVGREDHRLRVDLFHMHAPGKPKEGAYGPLLGLPGVSENLPIMLCNFWTKFQRPQRQEGEPHVTGKPDIRVSSGRDQVNQGFNFCS